MNPTQRDELAEQLRDTTANAAADALKAIAEAGFATVATVTSATFVHDHAEASADAVVDAYAQIFAHDLLGAVAADVDAKGIDVGGVHVTTRLVDFASGKAPGSPISAIETQHVFPLDLPPITSTLGTFHTTATLTVHVRCEVDAVTRALTPSTTVDVELALTWSSGTAGAGSSGT